MNRSSLIIAGAVAAVVLTAVLLFGRDDAKQSAAATSPTDAGPITASSSVPTPSTPTVTRGSATVAPPAATGATASASDDEDAATITFKADAKGRIVTDESARLNIERLYALYSPEERQKKLDELAATLPQAASRDLNDLMERYTNYSAAQRQTFPPGQDLSTPEDGLAIIDGMHALRVQYFGADAANALFGKEEQIQRELLHLVSLEKDPSMTLEERAERAQALYQSQMPDTSAELAKER